MFNRSRSKQVEKFADDLVQEIVQRFPPAAEGGAARGVMKFARAVDEVCRRAAAFKRDHGLGMFLRAKLGTEFKLRLRERGYPEDFVNELTVKLLMSMSGK